MHAAVLHHETNGITVGAATETMIKLLGGAYREGGSFFTMKWAAGAVVRTCSPEGHVALDDIDNVCPVEQFLNE
jgi:hypothetical protein